jgi:hypothetical protein
MGKVGFAGGSIVKFEPDFVAFQRKRFYNFECWHRISF